MRDLCQGLSSLEAVRTGVKGTDLQGDQPWHPHTSGNEKNLEDHVTTRYPVGCLGRPRLFQNRPPLTSAYSRIASVGLCVVWGDGIFVSEEQ
jgi:hypothetical protein